MKLFVCVINMGLYYGVLRARARVLIYLRVFVIYIDVKRFCIIVFFLQN